MLFCVSPPVAVCPFTSAPQGPQTTRAAAVNAAVSADPNEAGLNCQSADVQQLAQGRRRSQEHKQPSA